MYVAEFFLHPFDIKPSRLCLYGQVVSGCLFLRTKGCRRNKVVGCSDFFVFSHYLRFPIILMNNTNNLLFTSIVVLFNNLKLNLLEFNWFSIEIVPEKFPVSY